MHSQPQLYTTALFVSYWVGQENINFLFVMMEKNDSIFYLSGWKKNVQETKNWSITEVQGKKTWLIKHSCFMSGLLVPTSNNRGRVGDRHNEDCCITKWGYIISWITFYFGQTYNFRQYFTALLFTVHF